MTVEEARIYITLMRIKGDILAMRLGTYSFETRYNENHDPKTGRFTSGSRVDNGGESGIIKIGSDSVDLEYQRYGRNKTTAINKSYIDSGEYRKKFDKISENPKVNKALYDSAKTALAHRSGTLYEDMYWIDSNSGKIIASETNSKTTQEIVYSDKTKRIINNTERDTIIALHTHPSSMPPSVADFNSCYRNGYKQGYIACHNGKLYKYTAKQEISEELYSLYIKKFIFDGFDEYNAQLNAIQKLKESHLIEFSEVI